MALYVVVEGLRGWGVRGSRRMFNGLFVLRHEINIYRDKPDKRKHIDDCEDLV